MGFGDSTLLFKINFILLIIAVLIQILGLALPYWLDFDFSDYHSGLWQACTNGECRKVSSPDWLDASRAFSILGLLTLVAALVLVIIVLFVKDMKVLKLVTWILSFVAAFCIMIEFAVYADETSAFDDYYSGAFAITIIDFVLCLVIGVIGIIDWLGKGK